MCTIHYSYTNFAHFYCIWMLTDGLVLQLCAYFRAYVVCLLSVTANTDTLRIREKNEFGIKQAFVIKYFMHSRIYIFRINVVFNIT